MHGIWETVADALFWLQLCWIFSGFLLMAYLAFKVFPTSSKPSDTKVINPYAGNSFQVSGGNSVHFEENSYEINDDRRW